MDRLIMVVESFLDAPRQNLSQVASACGMDPATATRYLRTLVDHGWLDRDPATRVYTLGVRLFLIGSAVRKASPLRRRIVPHLHRLLEQFDETVNLAVHQGPDVVVIESLESRRSLRKGASLGDRDEWFVSSLGKSILAHLAESEVLAMISDRPPVRRTPKTLTDPEAILADLAEVRRRGYSVDDEESELGLKCIGTPISEAPGQYSFAVSISGPTSRIDARFDEIVDALRDVARTVGLTDGEGAA
jgi:IclR family acetate operon transcriptional repressor